MLARRGPREKGDTRATNMMLSSDFRNGVCLDLSPDGSKIALYITEHPTNSFRLQARGIKEVGSGGQNGELTVLDLRTGQRIVSRTENRLPLASFFADGERLFVQSSSATGGQSIARSRSVLRLTSGSESEIQSDEYTNQVPMDCYALDDGRLLGVELHFQEHQKDSLLITKLPHYTEVARVGLPTPGDGEANLNVEPSFSADRARFVYKRGRTIVARQTQDLGTIWTHSIDSSAWGAVRAEYSPNAKWVVIAVRGRPTGTYVEVLNGDSGNPVARFSLNGNDGVGISSDGSRLAVGKQVPGPSGTRVESRVSIHEVSSGREMGFVVLAESTANRAFLEGGFGYHGIRFTPDGRHLIVSGNHTKIWRIS